MPLFIHIYGKETIENPDLSLLSEFLLRLMPNVSVDLREDFFVYMLKGKDKKELDTLAKRLAEIRVLSPLNRELNAEPLYGEIEYEKRKLLNPATTSIGVFYDGFEFRDTMVAFIKINERNLRHLHIVFTNQLIATWEEEDRRYHARASVFGFPSIISTSGIVEAPAKNREYYLTNQILGRDGLMLHDIKKAIEDRYIDYNDSRMTEIAKGYVAQALSSHLTGYPFCDDRGCRLFNAHWQEELIYSQIESPYEFCNYHERMINSMQNPENSRGIPG
ncbi:MAG: DUF6775 family putative metallopeptidase [Nitrospirota bacterium]